MLIIVFVFMGIEGASMYSRYARKREDVGKATVFGFLGVLGVFALVTLVSYGAMSQGELAAADQPSVASVLASAFVQTLLIVLLFVDDALDFMLDLTAALALVPYFLSALYMLRLVIRRETYDDGDRRRNADLVIAVLYTAFLVYAAGLDKLLLACVLYGLGTILFVIARREQGLRVFRPFEAVVFGVIAVGAIVGIVLMATGVEDIYDHPEQERHSNYVTDPSGGH